jgi:serine phosphatase RsbU (regulator of sigma subunit)
MLKKVFFLCIFGLITSQTCFSQIISLKDSTQRYSVDTSVLIFVDSTNKVSFQDIQKPSIQNKFIHNKTENPTFGYSPYHIWVKFTIENKTNTFEDWVLSYDWVLIDTLYIYQKTQGKWQQTRMGHAVPFNERIMPYITFGIPLALTRDSVNVFYLEIINNYPTVVNSSILSKDSFANEQYHYNLSYGLYFGSLLVMMLYNFFIWIFLKDKSYLFYILTIFCTLSIFSTVTGYGAQYLWPNFPEMNIYYARLAIFGIIISTSLFTNSFLETKKYLPIFRYIFIAMMVMACLGILFLFFDQGAKHFGNELLKIHTLLLLTTGIVLWSRGRKVARFYVLAWVSYIIGGIGMTYSNTGHLPINFFTRHGVEIGSVLEVILLSLALSDKYRLFRKEKEDAIEELLKIEKQTNEELEEKVKIRTQQQEETNEELLQSNEELNVTIEKVNEQKIAIEKQQEQILSSINYARNIQKAILPRKEEMDKLLKDYFVLFKPKDVVSGDFYYCTEKDNKVILAAIDCTGHGVPGAFMSLIANDLLTEIIINRNILEVDVVLNKMHKGIRRILRQKENKNRDGMDLSLVIIDKQTKTLDFAGASNHLIYIQDKQLYEIRGDKKSIGGEQREQARIFTKHTISLEKPTQIYLFSDGYQDQFGGPSRKKFMIKTLRELLLKIHTEDLSHQQEMLEDTIVDWMNQSKESQIDDILVLGVKI